MEETLYNKETEYSKIYNYFYTKFYNDVKKTGVGIKNNTKTARIRKILAELKYEDRIDILDYFHYKQYKNPNAWKSRGIDMKKLTKRFEVCSRYMYNPKFIEIAAPGYYTRFSDKDTKFNELDFGGKKYIVTALNKAGIYNKDQLYAHLKHGWYYLWTIPGCGDGARQRILMTLDEWNNKANYINNSICTKNYTI